MRYVTRNPKLALTIAAHYERSGYVVGMEAHGTLLVITALEVCHAQRAA